MTRRAFNHEVQLARMMGLMGVMGGGEGVENVKISLGVECEGQAAITRVPIADFIVIVDQKIASLRTTLL